MRERKLTTRQAEDLEYVDEEELLRQLDKLASHIGWVIIYFNSLEDSVSFYLRELLLHDPFQDERLDVFLAEMLFAGKVRSLVHIYGQMAEGWGISVTHAEVAEIERTLVECAKRRNEYAHAHWIDMRDGPTVRVKSQSKPRGIEHRYKLYAPADVAEDVAYISAARHALDEFHERMLTASRAKPTTA